MAAGKWLHDPNWRERQRRRQIATWVGGALPIGGFALVAFLSRNPPESEWCEIARNVADGPSGGVINEVGVEESLTISDRGYQALGQASEHRVIRRAALDARPADFSDVSLDRRQAARRELSRHAERECDGQIRF